MDKRIRIGVIFFYVRWMGGIYYIQNLLMALNRLSDERKPVVDLYCRNEEAYNMMKAMTGYPYLEKNIVNPMPRIKMVERKLLSFFSRKASYNVDYFDINPKDIIVYPYYLGSRVEKLVHWIPDFQDKYLSELFAKKEIKTREKVICEVCERKIPIVFSSKDSQNDFFKFYPQYSNVQTFVLPFAVHQEDYSTIDVKELKKKYNIKKQYLICPNQFWAHKNHLFLFKAFKKILDSGMSLQLVCTGRMVDDRSPEYIDIIKRYIKDNQLDENILTLGVIEKKELLCLMKHSFAVIQPSLFEGWNTTVEDCKAMNKFIFLSDINVHREQIKHNVCFFNPHDEEDLVQKLTNVKPSEDTFDYNQNILEFANKFYDIIEYKLTTSQN